MRYKVKAFGHTWGGAVTYSHANPTLFESEDKQEAIDFMEGYDPATLPVYRRPSNRRKPITQRHNVVIVSVLDYGADADLPESVAEIIYQRHRKEGFQRIFKPGIDKLEL